MIPFLFHRGCYLFRFRARLVGCRFVVTLRTGRHRDGRRPAGGRRQAGNGPARGGPSAATHGQLWPCLYRLFCLSGAPTLPFLLVLLHCGWLTSLSHRRRSCRRTLG